MAIIERIRMMVSDYIAKFNSETQLRLEAIHAAILRVAPDAEESMSYGMPAYKLNNKPLIYFSGYDKHIGLYATPIGHEAFKNEFAPYKQGKGSVQFPHSSVLPIELIGKVIRFRVNQVTEEARGPR